MKIVFLSSVFGSPAGGAEVATELLFNELRNAGHSAYIMTTRKPMLNSDSLVTLGYIRLIPTKFLVPGTFITDHIIASRIAKKLKEIKPDVIHAQDSFILPATVIANRKLHLPCIVTCHNTVLDQTTKSASANDQIVSHMFKARNKTYLKFIKNVDAVISVSNYIKKELIFKGIESSKIHVIYNIPPDSINFKMASLNKTKTTITLFMQGRLVQDKDFDTIIKATKLITQKERSLKLIIAGNGPEMPRLKKLVNTLGLESYVLFTGWVCQSELMRLYAGSDIVLLPAVPSEAFGRGSIEAMSFGKPVVASNVGGISEAVFDGVNGFLVPAGDVDALAEAVLRLVKDRCLRERMGQAGREILGKRFSSEEIVRKTIKLYEEVIRAHTQRPRNI
ncbi:MAG: glycosyltransferase family 4 protein [Candidatus Bathyarchaeia archaeon]|jgi:glycosyltransferase involved in cell wall biosynthesis